MVNRPRLSRIAAVGLVAYLGALASCRGPEVGTLDAIRQRGALRWGADEEGGAPYVYRNPADPNQFVGFEVELMAQVAAGFGVGPQFVQGQWQNLLSTLAARDVDVVVNGYELTRELVVVNGYELTRERLRTAAGT